MKIKIDIHEHKFPYKDQSDILVIDITGIDKMNNEYKVFTLVRNLTDWPAVHINGIYCCKRNEIRTIEVDYFDYLKDDIELGKIVRRLL